MPTSVPARSPAALGAMTLLMVAACATSEDLTVTVEVTFPESVSGEALNGRLILVLSQREEGEPRTHVTDGAAAQPVFGIDVDGWAPGDVATLTDTVFGFPVSRLGDLPEASTAPRRCSTVTRLSSVRTDTRSSSLRTAGKGSSGRASRETCTAR